MKNVCLMILAAAGLLIAPAYADKPKVYPITLNSGTFAGTTELEAGQYHVLVHADEMRVQLRDADGNIKDVPAKVETADEKFDRTEIHTRKDGEANRIIEIRIGGTKYKINFAEKS